MSRIPGAMRSSSHSATAPKRNTEFDHPLVFSLGNLADTGDTR